MKIPKRYPRSQIGVNMGFRKIHLTQGWLVLNLFTGSISPHYHVVFVDMFSTLVSIIAAYPGFWIRMVKSSKTRIQVMLDQEYDTYFYENWMTTNERLPRLNKTR